MALDYFSGDYNRAGTYINSGVDRRVGEYYNGLVKSERWQINHANAAPSTGKQWMYNYTYDEHNWLTSATFGEFDHAEGVNRAEGENSFDIFPAFTPDSKEQYKVWNLSYDDNGNLQTLNRNMNERLVFGNTQVKMDEFSYRYKSGTNQLVHLNDNVTTSSFETDLKDQGTWDEETPANWNYEYDELGRMVANNDISEPRYFEYDATGLVTAVYDHSLKTDEDLLAKFVYDESGMRVKKTDYNSGSTPVKHTWYIRDAAGNVLAVYEQEDPTGTGTVDIEEKHIYGSGRIGQYNMIGKYLYELTDHRGNVRAVVSHNGVDLVWESYQDYYPGGALLWGGAHSFNAGSYRYDYQGIEKDGETGYNSFELRQYDGRLSRWMSVDPYQEFHSPYVGMGNNPIMFTDPDGGSIFGGGGGPKVIPYKGGSGPFSFGQLASFAISAVTSSISTAVRRATTGAQHSRRIIPAGREVTGDWESYTIRGSGSDSRYKNLHEFFKERNIKYTGRLKSIRIGQNSGGGNSKGHVKGSRGGSKYRQLTSVKAHDNNPSRSGMPGIFPDFPIGLLSLFIGLPNYWFGLSPWQRRLDRIRVDVLPDGSAAVGGWSFTVELKPKEWRKYGDGENDLKRSKLSKLWHGVRDTD